MSWAVQTEQQSKLKVLKELMTNRCKTRCVDVESKRI